jgi:hypothetical protein
MIPAAGVMVWELQTGLYNMLSGDVTLMSLMSKLYDMEVPEEEDTKFPYGVVGESYEVADNRLNAIGRESLVTIHVYDRRRGKRNVSQIMSQMVRTLEHQTIPVAGWHVVQVLLEDTRAMAEGDGIIHGVVRFRIKGQPIL